MSMTSLSAIDRHVQDALARLCARQWSAIGGLGSAHGDGVVRSVVDPEALVLASIVAGEADYRLMERLGWWSRVGAKSTSVQRLRTIAQAIPEPWRSHWRAFAAAASERGAASWRPHAAVSDDVPIRHRTTAERVEPSFASPAALLLRLRAGFGVNARADLLGCLVTTRSSSMTASRLAHELVYSESAVKRAARDMASAGLIREYAGHPAEYAADSAWATVLGLGDRAPTWIPWGRVIPWFADVVHWSRTTADLAPYPRASAARDVLERHRRTLERLPPALPDPARHPGEAFGDAFVDYVRRSVEALQSA
jgi:hypothetical protein